MKTRTGREMFFTVCSPWSSKAMSSRSPSCSLTASETQIPPGSAKRLQARREVDAVAEDVALLDDHVAEIDADAEADLPLAGDVGVAFGHAPLHLGRALDGVDDARELHQHAVAGGLDDPAFFLGDGRIDQLEPMRAQPGERARLVRLHEPAVAHHVGREHRREPTLEPPLLHEGSRPAELR